MIRELRGRPDFARVVERMEAWWQGETLERPLLNLWVRQESAVEPLPARHYDSERDAWLDAEYRVEMGLHGVEQGHYIMDSFPIYFPNLGPEITATLYGCELEFSSTTSWSYPVVHEVADWHRILETPPDFDNIYWRTIEAMTDYALEINDRRAIIGMADLHGNYDILAALRDPQALAIDMVDEPELIQRVGHHVAQGFNEAFKRLYQKVSAAGMGSTTWFPLYHEGPAYIPSCDYWCMVSGTMARDMVLPDILTEIEPLERSIFHLDGPDALRHLDLLLEIPNLNAVQWVYGAGQEPAARWIETYKKIQAAGKGFFIHAWDAQDALRVLEATGPRGAWIAQGQAFDSVDEAEAFVEEVERICRQPQFLVP